jgi:hypothetical protein
MENKKGEVALNDKLLDMVSGGIPVGGPKKLTITAPDEYRYEE